MTQSGSQRAGLSELDAYLASNCITLEDNALTFWHKSCNVEKFPRLHVLHLHHHCVPATSAAMERVFSAAGYIVNARRSRLSDTLIEDMLIAKCNAELLQ